MDGKRVCREVNHRRMVAGGRHADGLSWADLRNTSFTGSSFLLVARLGKPIRRTRHAGWAAIQHMGVDHRGREVAMTEQLLHGADIAPVLDLCSITVGRFGSGVALRPGITVTRHP